MRRRTELPELLAPAGSMEALFAAVEAGADAVYLGGRLYGARAFAKNFDEEEIRTAVRYCHLYGVRVYVTVNTLLFDKELSDALRYLHFLYEAGVDAIISADLGLISLARRHLPDLEIHASTQMSLHNTEGVRFAEELGVTRAVVARECSLSDIRAIVDESPLQIEVFLHGALCVCHSGQCLFSSLVGGRSGNRGECAQPCRLPYNGKDRYPLSLKDLSLSGHVRELIDLGVSSLKIEGRMKSPAYVYGVTSIYRRLLDERRNATAEENRTLASLFSRGGFTDAYAVGKCERPMTGIRSEEDKERSRALEERTFTAKKKRVRAVASFCLGHPSHMTVSDSIRSVTVVGDIPSVAQNAPLKLDDLQTRLCKMGNTLLSLFPDDLLIELDDGINLPPSSINALRRAAADAFENAGRTPIPFAAPELSRRAKATPLKTAEFFSVDAYDALSDESKAYFDIVFLPLSAWGEDHGAKGVALPPVVMEHEWASLRERVMRAVELGATHALISNPSELALARELGLLPVGDFRLNVTNRESAALWRERGLRDLILSPELTLPQARDVGGGVIVYGRIPLMLTERCFVRENGGCASCGSFSLTDRMGKQFPILREAEHRNVIFNSLPTYLGDARDELCRAGLFHAHFIFSTEKSKEIAAILKSYERGASLPYPVRRMKK